MKEIEIKPESFVYLTYRRDKNLTLYLLSIVTSNLMGTLGLRVLDEETRLFLRDSWGVLIPERPQVFSKNTNTSSYGLLPCSYQLGDTVICLDGTIHFNAITWASYILIKVLLETRNIAGRKGKLIMSLRGVDKNTSDLKITQEIFEKNFQLA